MEPLLTHDVYEMFPLTLCLMLNVRKCKLNVSIPIFHVIQHLYYLLYVFLGLTSTVLIQTVAQLLV